MNSDRLKVLSAIIDQGVIPVFSHPDASVCIKVIFACMRGGAECFEFTNRGEGALEVFREIVHEFRGESGLILGVGSVADAPTAALFIAYGAQFIVGPMLNPEIARLCNRRKIAYLPGCATPSEISEAEELGCELVKLFPGGAVGGPDFVKAVLGPMPWSRLMPTGGVEPTEDSLRQWFSAGISACGIGSNLITKSLVMAKDYAGIQNRVSDVMLLVQAIQAQAKQNSR